MRRPSGLVSPRFARRTERYVGASAPIESQAPEDQEALVIRWTQSPQRHQPASSVNSKLGAVEHVTSIQ